MDKYGINIGGHWGIRSPVVIGAIELFNNLVREPEMTKNNCKKIKENMHIYLTEVAAKIKRSKTNKFLEDTDRAILNTILNEIDPKGNYDVKKPDDNL